MLQTSMLSLETALLTALAAVTSALTWVAARLWQRSEECEKDRNFLRSELLSLLEKIAKLEKKTND